MIAANDRHGEFSSCITCGYEYDAPFPNPERFLQEARLATGMRRRNPSHDKLRLQHLQIGRCRRVAQLLPRSVSSLGGVAQDAAGATSRSTGRCLLNG